MEKVPDETTGTESNTDVRDASSDNLAILRLQEENQTLQEENYYLRHEVDKAEDKVHQLNHELAQKQMLMKLYHKELESVEGKRAEKKGFNWKSTLTCLRTKAKTLEHEKWELTEELESRKAELEAREAKLESLQSSYIRQIENLKSRISRHEETVRAQEERNVALQAEKDLLGEKFSLWAAERERVKQELETRDKQLLEFENREGEILKQISESQHELDNLRRLYEDRRDEAKRLRMNNMPLNGRPRSRSANDSTCYSSIKDELEESLRREREADSDTQSESSSSFRHVFETARSANHHAHSGYLQAGELPDPFAPHARADAVAMDVGSPTFSIGGDSGWGSDDDCSVHFPNSADRRRHRGWKCPSRLQLVKPMEGSDTLHQWQELATPTLNKVFEPRDGIVSRHEVEAGNHLTVDWSMREQLLSEPEEDDDPALEQRLSAGPPEISQSLTDDFIKGISCFGVSPRRVNSDVSMSSQRESEPMRPRSTSLVEKVQRSGIRAVERPRLQDRRSAKSLQDEMTPFASGVGFGERRYTLPSASSAAAALGLNRFTQNFLRRRQASFGDKESDTAKKPTEDISKIADTTTKDSFAAQLLNLIGGPFGSEPGQSTIRCIPISQKSHNPQHDNGSWKISTRDNKAEKRGKLKIKILKKKKPEFTISHATKKPEEGKPNVLHTITNLRKNNLLIGGIGDLPEVPTSPFHESAFIKDITLDIF